MMKRYMIHYYHRFNNRHQTFEVSAKNAFRAGRDFYRQHNRKVFHKCIEEIKELPLFLGAEFQTVVIQPHNPEPMTVTIMSPKGEPMVRFVETGEIYLGDRLADNDIEVVDAMRKFLSTTGHYVPRGTLKRGVTTSKFQAHISENNYVGHNGWVEEMVIDVGPKDMLEDFLKPFSGKHVTITIECST